MQQKSIDLFA